MKLTACSFLTGIAICLAATQAKLTILVGGKESGEVSVSQKILADGTKSVQLSMEIRNAQGRFVHIRSESIYDAKGAPIRKFLESIAEKPHKRRQVVATFNPEGVQVIEEVDGKRTTKLVTLVKTAPRENPSEFWFLRDRPKAGASVQYYRFDMDSLAWVLSTTTFVGPKQITLGKSKLSGFEVREDRASTIGASTIVDDRGLPLRMEMGGVVCERKAPN